MLDLGAARWEILPQKLNRESNVVTDTICGENKMRGR